MPSESLRPVAVILLNFIVGYIVVAFVSRWFRKKPPVTRRDRATLNDPRSDGGDAPRGNDSPPWDN
jgi:hypothetical protein